MSSFTIESRTARVAAPAVGSWRNVLVKSIGRGFAWIASRRRMRHDIDALMALDDRMLADIGLGRGDVEYVARYGRLPDRPEDRLGR
jgi:uncharacterized protein YjiS (DUF1127 family)